VVWGVHKSQKDDLSLTQVLQVVPLQGRVSANGPPEACVKAVLLFALNVNGKNSKIVTAIMMHSLP
jgi:hypothetical protein